MKAWLAVLLFPVALGAQVVNPGGGSGNATTVNGAAVPASQSCLGSNSSSQIIAGTCTAPTPTVTTLTGTTPAINAANPLQTITLSGNTTPTVTGITAGYTIRFQICQPATGGPYTFTWPTAFHGAMVVGTVANTCSMQAFTSFSGTTMVADNTGITGVAP